MSHLLLLPAIAVASSYSTVASGICLPSRLDADLKLCYLRAKLGTYLNQPSGIVYWEGGKPPAYITLCVTSWLRYISIDSLTVLNQSNLCKFLGDSLEIRRLRHLGLAQQSDLVSAVYLAKFGGYFVDADTIFTNPKCLELIRKPSSDQLRLFGYHIGFLVSPEHGTAASFWGKVAADKLKQDSVEMVWNEFGNGILDPFADRDENRGFVDRMSIPKAEVTPEREAAYWDEFPRDIDRTKLYQRFWFGEPQRDVDVTSRLASTNCGVVCLHNSWTPSKFKELSAKEVLTSDTQLGTTLAEFSDPSRFGEVEELLTYGS